MHPSTDDCSLLSQTVTHRQNNLSMGPRTQKKESADRTLPNGSALILFLDGGCWGVCPGQFALQLYTCDKSAHPEGRIGAPMTLQVQTG